MTSPGITNPATDWLLKEVKSGFRMGQIVFLQEPFLHIRHESDLEKPASDLKKTSIAELRILAQTTSQGAFRPLKSSPDLASGWMVELGTQELELALNSVYPGALADLYLFMNGRAEGCVTSYRTFTARQTGMYRISTHLTDEQVAPVMEACCDNRVCRKTRLWDIHSGKSESLKFNIPCFEPCALMLEFARKSARMNDNIVKTEGLTASDLETIRKALEFTLNSLTVSRVTDFSDESNERRLLLAFAKIKSALK